MNRIIRILFLPLLWAVCCVSLSGQAMDSSVGCFGQDLTQFSESDVQATSPMLKPDVPVNSIPANSLLPSKPDFRVSLSTPVSRTDAKTVQNDFEEKLKKKFPFKPKTEDFERKQRNFTPALVLPDSAVRLEQFHWKPAITESLLMLAVQHGVRMTQKKTRADLDGPFFSDWGHSIKNLRGWGDYDSHFTNYVAHPMQGAMTGRIFVVNSDKALKQEFGKSKDYWESRFKAMAWSAAWSAQFELGLFSETSIGNVGIHDDVGKSRMSWKDLIITPTAGTGLLVVEDIVEKYVLRGWLQKKSTRTKMKIYRSFLLPFQSLSNVLKFRKPWYQPRL